MKDKQFDQLIRDKMGDLEVPLNKGGWETFVSKLDQSSSTGVPGDQSDHDFDELIFNKLNNFEAPFNPAHWSQMQRRIRVELGWPKIMLSYKLAETTLIALLVFVATHQLKNNQPLLSVRHLGNNKVEKVAATAFDTGSPTNQPTDRPADIFAQANVLFQPNPVTEYQTPTPVTQADPSLRLSAMHFSTLPPTGNDKIYPENPADYLVAAPVVSKSANDRFAPAFMERQLIPANYAPYINLDAVIVLPERETLLRIGMTGSLDYNRVITPPDVKENRLEVYDRYAPGYSNGISIGFEMGKFEIETGIGYSSKHYLPQPVVFVQGSLQEGFIGEGIREIELNMLSLPLNFKFHFLNREKWRLYALAGTTLQFAFHNNYYTSTQSFTNGFAKPLLSAGQVSPLEDNKVLKAGFFEGGPFAENSYLTGNVGIGIERNFSYRWSLFVQPTYQHSMDYFGLLDKHLGPNKDQIRTFSVLTGIKMRLFK